MPRILSLAAGGNAFTIIQPDNGTSPTATSTNSVLTFTSTDHSVTITGNSATNTVNFTVSPVVLAEVSIARTFMLMGS